MKPMDDFRVQYISTNGIRSGKIFEQFTRFLKDFYASGKAVGKIEFTCPEVMDLQTQLTSTRESLAIALRALESISDMAPLDGDNEEDWMHESTAKNAIAEITKRGDYIPEGKGKVTRGVISTEGSGGSGEVHIMEPAPKDSEGK